MIPLGPFDIVELAGRGGMAEVWRGVHREQRIPVAMKVVTAALGRRPQFLAYFKNEVRAVAGLEHPHIVTVLDHGEIDAEVERASAGLLRAGSPYLVMEWASYGTLGGRPPIAAWAGLREILLGLLDALAHAHARGVVHRDIKPRNVLVCGPDDMRPGLKLADFGVARPANPELEAPGAVGTPHYMAPEQRTAQWRDHGPWTDLYAFGCLAFKLATGFPLSKYRALGGGMAMPLPPSAPAGLDQWILRLANEDPQLRFRRAADAAWALRELELASPGSRGTGPSGSRGTGPTGAAGSSAPSAGDSTGVERERTEGHGSWTLLAMDVDLGPAPPEGTDASDRASASARSATGSDRLGRDTLAAHLESLPTQEWEGAVGTMVDRVPPSASASAPEPPLPSGSAGVPEPVPPSGPARSAAAGAFAASRAHGSGGLPAVQAALAVPAAPASGPWAAFSTGPDIPVPQTGRSVPPLPATWRRRVPAVRSMRLVGAGLGLYGVRPIPLVDREEERDALWAALRRTCAERRAELVLLQGPAGSGKSRLAEWLGERAHEVGAATVLRATHGPLPGAGDGIRALVARHFRLGGLERPAVLVRLEAVLRAQGVVDPDEWHALAELVVPASDAERAAGHVIRLEAAAERHVLVRRLIERLTVERPVVLWLDDVQWGLDALGLAEHLLEALVARPSPVLIVMTAREHALTERPLEATRIAALLARPHTSRVDVGLLAPEHRPALIRALLGLEGELATRVEERTAGNPLFAVQLVGDWVQRGVLVAAEGGFRLREGARAELPDGLHEMWAEGVTRLLEERGGAATTPGRVASVEQTVRAQRAAAEGWALEIAAVLGHDVDFAEWTDVCTRCGAVGSLELVEALLVRRLARCGTAAGPESSWSFVHGMLRESLERRAALAGRLSGHHRACADLLRGRSGPGIAERLGRHLVAAGQLEEALGPLLDGAAERAGGGDFAHARALLAERDRALAAVALPLDDVRHGEGWVLWGRVERGEGAYDASEAHSRRAVEHGERPGWARVQARAYLGLGSAARDRGDVDGAIAWLTEAERRYQTLGDRGQLATCWRVRGAALADRAEFAAAEALYDRALEAFVAANDEAGAATTLLALGFNARQRGRQDEGLGYIARARVAFEHAGSRAGTAACLNALGELARARGDLASAERHYAAALGIYRAIGGGLFWLMQANLALVLSRQERWPEARALLKESLEVYERQGRRSLVAALNVSLLPCVAALGDWEAFDRHHALGVSLLADTGLVDADVADAARVAGDIARGKGHAGRARHVWEIAAAQLARLGRTAEAEAVAARLRELG